MIVVTYGNMTVRIKHVFEVGPNRTPYFQIAVPVAIRKKLNGKTKITKKLTGKDSGSLAQEAADLYKHHKRMFDLLAGDVAGSISDKRAQALLLLEKFGNRPGDGLLRMKVSPSVKEGFLKGLNKSVNETHSFHKLKTAATLNSIVICRKILKLAEMNIGLVKVTPSGVLFPREEDNQAYAQALVAIQKEASDEEKYANAIVNYQQAAVNKMKNALSK